MNKNKIALCLITITALLSGCYTAPTREEASSANYGPPVSSDEMLAQIKAYMSKRLIDPGSAIYNCNRPVKGWVLGAGEDTPTYTYYGYMSDCEINAKNRFGGYTGAQTSRFMIFLKQGGGRGIIKFHNFKDSAVVSD